MNDESSQIDDLIKDQYKDILLNTTSEKYKEFEKKTFNRNKFNNWNTQNLFKKHSQTIGLKKKKEQLQE